MSLTKLINVTCGRCGTVDLAQVWDDITLPMGWMRYKAKLDSEWINLCDSCSNKGATVFDDDDAKDIKDSDIPGLNVSTNQNRP